jgi:hypothetical protein
MKKFKIKRNNTEEIKTEKETKEFLLSKVTPGFLTMMSNLQVTEGMFHYETFTEIIRIE